MTNCAFLEIECDPLLLGHLQGVPQVVLVRRQSLVLLQGKDDLMKNGTATT